MTYQLQAAATFGGLLLLAGCVGAPKDAPTPPPAARPVPPPPSPALPKDWRAWPVAKGDWSYQKGKDGSIAAFGEPGKPMLVVFRCESATRRIHMLRTTPHPAQPGSQMVIHTSYGSVQWPIAVETNVTDGYVGAVRASNDAVLDQIAFSRGRFAIEVPGTTPISVPNWAEITRVIEDCRG
ncbi:MAG: hypothetical protein E2598_08625 [Sphingobium sp.]|nr:hypothetical protein [Sphingobium sp.]